MLLEVVGMAIRMDGSSLQRLQRRPVAAGGGVAVQAAPSVVTPAAPSVPDPAKSNAPTLPVPDPRKATELVDALLHPIRTLKGFFAWGKNMLAFDGLGAINTQNAPHAAQYLSGMDGGLNLMGLARLLPFMARAVDKRAAAAVTQLRPSIEEGLTARSMHGVNIVWPVGGSNYKAFQELMAFDAVFKEYPDAAVQKVLAGVAEINVQRLDLWDMANPIKRQAATLVIQRPITWLPGQRSIEESLRSYLTQASTVSVTI